MKPHTLSITVLQLLEEMLRGRAADNIHELFDDRLRLGQPQFRPVCLGPCNRMEVARCHIIVPITKREKPGTGKQNLG